MNTAYIVCRGCGSRIYTPFICRCDAPPHFVATCPRCGYRGVYSYEDLAEQDEKMCRESCEKVSNFKQKLDTYIGLSMLVDAVTTVMANVAKMLFDTEEKKEDKQK
jgi:hypothetical protein